MVPDGGIFRPERVVLREEEHAVALVPLSHRNARAVPETCKEKRKQKQTKRSRLVKLKALSVLVGIIVFPIQRTLGNFSFLILVMSARAKRRPKTFLVLCEPLKEEREQSK